ncbi:MAG: hypothetical protein GY947_05280 [Rhodobacteraceae bacterium]|nr:hypothetical protein [Paracoccaceae bacterium]
MDLESKVVIQGNPEIKLKSGTTPIAFDMAVDGGLTIHVGEIAGSIEPVRIYMRIPFMRCGEVEVGSFGPFGVRLQPIEATVKAFGVQLEGNIGKDGINCEMDGQMSCKMDIDLQAKIPASMAKAALREMLEE